MPQVVVEAVVETVLVDQEATEKPAVVAGAIQVVLRLAVRVVQAAAMLAVEEPREVVGQPQGEAPHLVEEVEGRVVPFALALRQPGDPEPEADLLAALEEVLAGPSLLLFLLALRSSELKLVREILGACLLANQTFQQWLPSELSQEQRQVRPFE